jgi:hypothetical protein
MNRIASIELVSSAKTIVVAVISVSGPIATPAVICAPQNR